jgi:tripartite-type tricarboxylate transporter receptor subunit TctC
VLRPPPYRTLEAFAPVTLVATGPLALVAHPFAPYATYADVVRAARREPGAVRYATSGVGGLAHVAATLLQQAGGYRLAHVPYPGGGPAAQDAVAGRVPLLMSNVVPCASTSAPGRCGRSGCPRARRRATCPACAPSRSRACRAASRR